MTNACKSRYIMSQHNITRNIKITRPFYFRLLFYLISDSLIHKRKTFRCYTKTERRNQPQESQCISALKFLNLQSVNFMIVYSIQYMYLGY